ncbi:MmcQ/YjbR family DNA-binding protein [Plantibacter sp. ME-Dv--P-122b]|uniref:MmcQ/YjbR family DNA-binding protein n=1 Tax=Plantibacter sp. ME-Dv--P-122b TaxID=3040300 RepID=UPI00254AB10D|nr:MmcQ/YjbR family DNA-binding protein [Plantibacter sp. ME-Dv--P-122b]
MEHPIVHDPDDPFVERVRRICLAYPEAVETFGHGRPRFKAGKRVFVTVGSEMRIPHSITFTPAEEERGAWLEDERFWSPKYDGPSGKLAFDAGLDGNDGRTLDDVDWALIAELIDTSYRQVALQRQLRALDAR